MAASPYDYLRLDFAPKADAKTGWPDAAYDYVTDPRTKFARPRIVDLAGGTPIEAANALLKSRHWHRQPQCLELRGTALCRFPRRSAHRRHG